MMVGLLQQRVGYVAVLRGQNYKDSLDIEKRACNNQTNHLLKTIRLLPVAVV